MRTPAPRSTDLLGLSRNAPRLVLLRVFLLAPLLVVSCRAAELGPASARGFDPRVDLVSLHYDHAPDRDDGQSAAADRTLLQCLYGFAWLSRHAIAVSGACGENAALFDPGSDAVMDEVWNACGGWLAGHDDPEGVRAELTRRWLAVLDTGGHVWVKEGGQSDLTADVVERIRARRPALETRDRIHVVQHSRWNEDQTTDAALATVRAHTAYLAIRDANAYLNRKGGDAGFVRAAVGHPELGGCWRAAFAYYPPEVRLDFSDTGELLHIVGLGEIGLDEFRARFLEGTPR